MQITLDLPDSAAAWLNQQPDPAAAITAIIADRIARNDRQDPAGGTIIRKAARLAALAWADQHGIIEGYTLQQIADRLGERYRSTICRDVQALGDYIQYRDRYIKDLTPQ